MKSSHCSADLDHAVAARRRGAAVGAAVVVVGVAVVTRLDARDRLIAEAVAAGVDLAGVEAVVGVDDVGVVALLAGGAVDLAVAAVVRRAVAVAAGRLPRRARVAILTGVDHAVATALDLTGRRAAVVVGGVAVVALLAAGLDPVAAGRGPAVAIAAVAVGGVHVVALLDAGPSLAVAAERVVAIDACVGVVRVAVVAEFARVDDAVAAGRQPATDVAAVAVVLVAVVARLRDRQLLIAEAVAAHVDLAVEPAVGGVAVGASVVALLAGRAVDLRVTAAARGAVRVARRRFAAVVARLAVVDHAVATALELAGGGAAIAVRQVVVVAGLVRIEPRP